MADDLIAKKPCRQQQGACKRKHNTIKNAYTLNSAFISARTQSIMVLSRQDTEKKQ